jgi:hypothetical protein
MEKANPDAERKIQVLATREQSEAGISLEICAIRGPGKQQLQPPATG